MRSYAQRKRDYDAAVAHAEARRANHGGRVGWKTPGLRVTRVHFRVNGDISTIADFDSCEGLLGDRHVDVDLPLESLSRRTEAGSARSQLVNFARAHGVNAKRLGLLDDIRLHAAC